MTAVDNWGNNAIQYPRLIAEAEAAGAFTVARIADMAVSMDLDVADVNDLIARACETWDDIVAATPEGPFPVTTWDHPLGGPE